MSKVRTAENTPSCPVQYLSCQSTLGNSLRHEAFPFFGDDDILVNQVCPLRSMFDKCTQGIASVCRKEWYLSRQTNNALEFLCDTANLGYSKHSECLQSDVVQTVGSLCYKNYTEAQGYVTKKHKTFQDRRDAMCSLIDELVSCMRNSATMMQCGDGTEEFVDTLTTLLHEPTKAVLNCSSVVNKTNRYQSEPIKSFDSSQLIFVPFVFITVVILAMLLILSLIYRRHFKTPSPSSTLGQMEAGRRQRARRMKGSTYPSDPPDRLSSSTASGPPSKRLTMPVGYLGRFSTGSTTTMTSELMRMTELEMTSSQPGKLVSSQPVKLETSNSLKPNVTNDYVITQVY